MAQIMITSKIEDPTVRTKVLLKSKINENLEGMKVKCCLKGNMRASLKQV